MSNVEVVLCSPVRTAIGTYGGTLKDVAVPTLGAAVIRESLRRAGLAADKVHSLVMGNVIQAGVKMNPGRQAGIAGGIAGRRSGADGQPCLWVGRAGHRQRGHRNLGRHDRMRARRWYGKHGSQSLPAAARALGGQDGRRDVVRQHAARWAQRRL